MGTGVLRSGLSPWLLTVLQPGARPGPASVERGCHLPRARGEPASAAANGAVWGRGPARQPQRGLGLRAARGHRGPRAAGEPRRAGRGNVRATAPGPQWRSESLAERGARGGRTCRGDSAREPARAGDNYLL